MVKEIELTRDQVALVDDEDYPVLIKASWYALPRHNHWYAATSNSNGGPVTVYMHRVIMDAPDGMQVDHINHNGLDNRRRNLRICTQSENLRNRRANYVAGMPIDNIKSKAVQVRVTPKVHKAIAEIADRHDVTACQVVRRAIAQYIERNQPA